MAKNKVDGLALSYTAAILSAVTMLFLGIGWNLGFYVGAAEQMAKWHLFFSPSLGGILTGMVEAAVIGFVFVSVGVWLYFKLAKN